MSKKDLSYRDFAYGNQSAPCMPNPCCRPAPCSCCCVIPGCHHNPGYKAPFLSSYIEAVGNIQTVANNANIAFSVDEDTLDIAGNDIRINADGTVFTIMRAGLYHIEWSVNIGDSNPPVLIGILENGNPASALYNTATNGSHSSGALINVRDNDVPYTVSLHNFGGAMTLENPVALENTSASIRILRFADGPVLKP